MDEVWYIPQMSSITSVVILWLLDVCCTDKLLNVVGTLVLRRMGLVESMFLMLLRARVMLIGTVYTSCLFHCMCLQFDTSIRTVDLNSMLLRLLWRALLKEKGIIYTSDVFHCMCCYVVTARCCYVHGWCRRYCTDLRCLPLHLLLFCYCKMYVAPTNYYMVSNPNPNPNPN